MHRASEVSQALRLAGAGMSAAVIGEQLGIPSSTIRQWTRGRVPRASRAGVCDVCHVVHPFDELAPEYVYLLGLYLGDGCISTMPRTYRLRISLDAIYPQIIESAMDAIRRVRGGIVRAMPRPRRCVEVNSYWRAWPCLFPQHGPGKKHDRSIVLRDWQNRLVDAQAEQLLRGLIHSDGSRFQNTGRGWSAARYSFRQKSADIRSIFCEACDRIGVGWTSSAMTVYVSRKADVAILDRFIGPKR
jgi:hypothetical protein